ncbi:HlyD family secretion protein [Siccirubricoccus sp. KC 17139]|uniref:HlyD family secretion protein n=1 Tax=Siccirubricoccus soli TaxID=2899147 RepID=A0ABT1DAM2_9PROT|nr:HlyD family secretion protein [Siccirubricoccus soli]MCO6418989.1 HlyD family secretion protein [Siccirubricoccus soli]MCP2685124.1 HlyD family secretion protein [Siccirubricoccus soli]
MSSFRRRALLRLALLVLVPAAIIAGGLAFWLTGGRFVTTENAYVKADIVQIAPEIAGRVAEVAVRDHARVQSGEVLLRIDPEPFRLALAKAEAELDSARAQVETARATYHETLSELGELESRAEFLSRQARRQQDLAARGVSPAARLEETLSDAQVARERINVLRQRLARLLTTLKGNPELPTDDHPSVREQLAERDRAALDLARTVVTAPVGGTIVNMRLQRGEQVRAATPVFSLVSERRPWVEANLKETTLTHVAPGQQVKVVLDIYPDLAWVGVVESISPATGAEFAILPPQNASGNWVKVVQRLPVRVRLEPFPGEPPLRAGATATVAIDTGRQRQFGDLTAGVLGLFRDSAQAASGEKTARAQ